MLKLIIIIIYFIIFYKSSKFDQGGWKDILDGLATVNRKNYWKNRGILKFLLYRIPKTWVGKANAYPAVPSLNLISALLSNIIIKLSLFVLEVTCLKKVSLFC